MLHISNNGDAFSDTRHAFHNKKCAFMWSLWYNVALFHEKSLNDLYSGKAHLGKI